MIHITTKTTFYMKGNRPSLNSKEKLRVNGGETCHTTTSLLGEIRAN